MNFRPVLILFSFSDFFPRRGTVILSVYNGFLHIFLRFSRPQTVQQSRISQNSSIKSLHLIRPASSMIAEKRKWLKCSTWHKRRNSMIDVCIQNPVNKTAAAEPSYKVWRWSAQNIEYLKSLPNLCHFSVFAGGQWHIQGGQWHIQGGQWHIQGGHWACLMES